MAVVHRDLEQGFGIPGGYGTKQYARAGEHRVIRIGRQMQHND
jgi:hypothetical protein